MRTIIRGYTLSIISLIVIMSVVALGQINVHEVELDTVAKEAMKTVQISERQQIEDKLYGTENALCRIDNTCYYSNQDYLDDLAENIKTLKTSKSYYTIDVYGVDYQKGLLDVEIKCTFRLLAGTKTISKRITSIVEVIGLVTD